MTNSFDSHSVSGPSSAGGWVGQAWGALLVLGLFGAYPLALVCPVRLGTDLVFFFQLPVVFGLALAAATGLFALLLRGGAGGEWPEPRWGGRRLFLLGFLTVALWTVVLAGWKSSADLVQVVTTLGMFAVPLFVLLHPAGNPFGRRLPWVLAVLWAVQAAHGLWQWSVGFETVGLSGNRNWMGAVMAALLPWVWLVFAGMRVPSSGALPPGASTGAEAERDGTRWVVWLGMVLAGGVTLFLVWTAASRAVWLCLAAYAVIFVGLGRLRPVWRWPAALLLAGVLAAGAALLAPERVKAAVATDIRAPLWTQTLRMVADHPLTGVGPGNFRRDFVGYKSAAHKQRAVAATVTEHPHNELLRLAAELGIPAALLFAALLLPLLHRPPADSVGRALHFGAWMVAGPAMLDKTLVQPPACVLGLLFLGLLWRKNADLEPAVATPAPADSASLPASGMRPWVLRALVVMALLVGVVAGVRETAMSWCLRRGLGLEHADDQAGAFQSFARAAWWNPDAVEPLMLAGQKAARLRNPAQALSCFTRVRQIEPDFAHVNGEIGAALGGMGENEAAWPFFRREAQLFPFSTTAASRFLACSLVCGRQEPARHEAARLPALESRQITAALGRDRACRLAAVWNAPAPNVPFPERVEAAATLTEPCVRNSLPDPAVAAVLVRSAGTPEAAWQPLGVADGREWMLWAEVRNRLAAGNGAAVASPEAVLREWRRAEGAPAARAPLWVWFFQAGYDVLVRPSQAGAAPPRLLVRRDAWAWVVDAETGNVAAYDPAPGADPGRWALPLTGAATKIRFRLLAHALAELEPQRRQPRTYDWPALDLAAWREWFTRTCGRAPDIPLFFSPATGAGDFWPAHN